MDFRCSECRKTGKTEEEEFEKANIQAQKDGFDGVCDITLTCTHTAKDWHFMGEHLLENPS